MENPLKEIAGVVLTITTSKSADIQKATVNRYFLPDAAFRHPLCTVIGGPGSRERILKIYQWYRILSPHTEVEVKHVTMDTKRHLLYLEVVQSFHVRFSPFPAVPAKMLVRLALRKEGSLYFVERQDDFFSPEQLAAYAAAPLAPLVASAMWASGIIVIMLASISQVFGIWRPTSMNNGGLGATGINGNDRKPQVA